jgi:hypothetical protein
VHLKKRLPEETVDALEEASPATIACEWKVEGVDFRLGPVGLACGSPFEQAGGGGAIRSDFFVQNPVLVPEESRTFFVF